MDANNIAGLMTLAGIALGGFGATYIFNLGFDAGYKHGRAAAAIGKEMK